MSEKILFAGAGLFIVVAVIMAATALRPAATSSNTAVNVTQQAEQEFVPIYSAVIFRANNDTLILRNTGNVELTNNTLGVYIDDERQDCRWSLRPGLLQACILNFSCTGKSVRIETANTTQETQCK